MLNGILINNNYDKIPYLFFAYSFFQCLSFDSFTCDEHCTWSFACTIAPLVHLRATPLMHDKGCEAEGSIVEKKNYGVTRGPGA